MSNYRDERLDARNGGRVRATITVALVAIAALASASPAMAELKGPFKVFEQCPIEVTGVTLCAYNQTTSGEFKLGTSRVPINEKIIQQGGFIKTENPEFEREFYGVPAKNGETLSRTELNVPGGLAGLISCTEIKGKGLVEKAARLLCKEVFESGLTGVTATSELVANTTNRVLFNEYDLGAEEGPAVTLPIRVHLKNPLLGNNCYIGSEADPIILHLTTGETHPPAGFESLRGKLGEPETLEEDGLFTLRVSKDSLVDNTFPAPGTEGCGELPLAKGFLDTIINAKLKIPNKAGENTAVLNGELAASSAEEVIADEHL